MTLILASVCVCLCIMYMHMHVHVQMNAWLQIRIQLYKDFWCVNFHVEMVGKPWFLFLLHGTAFIMVLLQDICTLCEDVPL